MFRTDEPQRQRRGLLAGAVFEARRAIDIDEHGQHTPGHLEAHRRGLVPQCERAHESPVSRFDYDPAGLGYEVFRTHAAAIRASK
jgi:hypothetical protein